MPGQQVYRRIHGGFRIHISKKSVHVCHDSRICVIVSYFSDKDVI